MALGALPMGENGGELPGQNAVTQTPTSFLSDGDADKFVRFGISFGGMLRVSSGVSLDSQLDSNETEATWTRVGFAAAHSGSNRSPPDPCYHFGVHP